MKSCYLLLAIVFNWAVVHLQFNNDVLEWMNDMNGFIFYMKKSFFVKLIVLEEKSNHKQQEKKTV